MDVKLSEKTVRSLPVPDRGNRVFYFAGDVIQRVAALRGFGVRVTAKGARAFVLNYRATNGTERRYTIGASPDSVLDAVKRGRELRQKIDNGQDPIADRAAAKIPEPTMRTVAEVLDEFVLNYVRKNLRSHETVERALTFVKSEIGSIGIYALRRIDVAKMLDRVEERSGAVSADRTLAYVRKALNWYAARDGEFNSPIVRGMARTRPTERERKRFLSDDEIRDLWAALKTTANDGPFPAIVLCLLLSGQRRSDIARASWSELAEGLLIIPARRYKSKREHVVPLTPNLQALMGIRERSTGPFVFSTTNGDKPFSGFGKVKLALDAAISEVRAKAGREPMEPWVLHDLRRTASTLMNRAGVQENIVGRVLGHAIVGVKRVYNRFEYLDEKRDALERLGILLQNILQEPLEAAVQVDKGLTAFEHQKVSDQCPTDSLRPAA